MQFEVVDGDGTPNLQIYTNYKYTWLFRDSCVFTNVLKTGPDRPVGPVQPSAGHHSGPIRSFRPD